MDESNTTTGDLPLRPTTTRRIRTSAGSTIDPNADCITWSAWRMLPGPAVREGIAPRHLYGVLAETLWMPGRLALLSKVESATIAGSEYPSVSLGVGMLGGEAEVGEAGAAAVEVEAALSEAPFDVETIDPTVLLDAGSQHRVRWLIRQSVVPVDLGDDGATVELVSSWNPTPDPWTRVVETLDRHEGEVVVQATIVPTTASVADRQELESLRRECAARTPDEPDPRRLFAALTTAAHQERLTTPTFTAEISVTSETALPEPLLRAISCAFTSETGISRQEWMRVASSPTLRGGFSIEPAPAGHTEAARLGLPVYGSLRERELRDVVSLGEIPIGFPGRVPGVLAEVTSPTHRSDSNSFAVRIGRGPDQSEYMLSDIQRSRHVVVTGTPGTGKSTVLDHLIFGDLAWRRPFVVLDHHGDLAGRARQHAEALDVDPIALDGRGLGSGQFQILPAATDTAGAEVERRVGVLTDALASVWDNAEWHGPIWSSYARAIGLVASAHGAEVAEVAAWVDDSTKLRTAVDHPDVPPDARVRLLTLDAVENGREAGTREWVTSKLTALRTAASRCMVARAGEGMSPREVLTTGRPLVVDLSGMPQSDAAILGTLVLQSLAAEADVRDRSMPFTAYIDEAHLYPRQALEWWLYEGRKFHMCAVLATQALTQVSSRLRDPLLSSGLQVAFRQAPRSASLFGPILDEGADRLTRLPDLQALVAEPGGASALVHIDPYQQLPTDVGQAPLQIVPGPLRDPQEARVAEEGTDRSARSSLLDQLLTERP
ncbi:MAG: hypothetical protein GY788_07635 [bacterium]|nr:hypothetical protein [bacterium]